MVMRSEWASLHRAHRKYLAWIRYSMQVGHVVDLPWSYYVIVVLFFHPGEMEPEIPSTWLLHIIIPSFVIALIVIVAMIILKKQRCQKLSSRKGRWVLFTVAMWTGCLQWRALLSPLTSRFLVSHQIHSMVVNCFGFVLMTFPHQRKWL